MIVLCSKMYMMNEAVIEPIKSPKNTMEPITPILVSSMPSSAQMSERPAGIAPWSRLISTSMKKMYIKTNVVIVDEKPKSLTTSTLSTSLISGVELFPLQSLAPPSKMATEQSWLPLPKSDSFSATLLCFQLFATAWWPVSFFRVKFYILRFMLRDETFCKKISYFYFFQ